MSRPLALGAVHPHAGEREQAVPADAGLAGEQLDSRASPGVGGRRAVLDDKELPDPRELGVEPPGDATIPQGALVVVERDVPRTHRLAKRGPTAAPDEFHLAAAAQNRRKLAKLIPVSQPSPARSAGATLSSSRPRPTCTRSNFTASFFNKIGTKLNVRFCTRYRSGMTWSGQKLPVRSRAVLPKMRTVSYRPVRDVGTAIGTFRKQPLML